MRSGVAAGVSSLENVPLGRGVRTQGLLHSPIPGEGLEHLWVRFTRGVPVERGDLQHPKPLPCFQEPHRSLPWLGTAVFIAG